MVEPGDVVVPPTPTTDEEFAELPILPLGQICPMCHEPITNLHDVSPTILHTEAGAKTTHRSCMLREVVGGIGHLIAHEYWCPPHGKGDPDAGLTYRQSALLVEAWVHIMGTDAAVAVGRSD